MSINRMFDKKQQKASSVLPALAGVLLALSLNAKANHDEYPGEHGIVIFGYDPVAYFTQDQAVRGSKDITARWLGGTWLFANQEHRELFTADPDKYLPQYGGYCSASYTFGVDADPRNWQIVDDKLYLFYKKATSEGWQIGLSKSHGVDKEWDKAKAGLQQQIVSE
jgi:hypothetical protein